MEIPINQSGFVSNRSESQLQSQAPAHPEGRVEQPAGVLSVIALSDGESRKRGLGLRGSIPMKQRARGIKDPRWISFSSGRDWIVSFCRVRRMLTQIPEFSEWFLGTILGWSADSTSCRDGSVAAHFPLDLEGSESKSFFYANLQIIVPVSYTHLTLPTKA